MAEKLRDGISRELRYVEYKLRKRKSDNKKKKNSNASMGSSVPSISEDYKEAVPSNHNEEDMQLQVLLYQI